MDKETETKAIEKWLRMVDKPKEIKEEDKKDVEPKAVLQKANGQQ